MKKAQFALEFVMMVAAALIIGFGFLAVVTASLYDKSEEQRRSAIDDVGHHIQDELILASIVEDGYQRNISIPDKTDRFVYTISSTSEGIIIFSGAQTISYSTPEYSGVFQKGNNRITKTAGVITVS